MCLHVQASNEEALAFYKKHGFKLVEELAGYYKKIEPSDAFLLMKDVK